MRYVLFFITLITLTACDPKVVFERPTEAVKLNATIDNTAENINLGDTLIIRLTIPDTIVTSAQTVFLQNIQRIDFGMAVMLTDTANRRGSTLVGSNVWVTKGTKDREIGFAVVNNQRPYEVIIKVKPPQKGLYYFEIVPQPGMFRINNNLSAGLLVNFNVPNKHYNILSIIAPFFSGQAFYDAFIQRDLDGFGTYFFRVI